jgi:hypothetical protein
MKFSVHVNEKSNPFKNDNLGRKAVAEQLN